MCFVLEFGYHKGIACSFNQMIQAQLHFQLKATGWYMKLQHHHCQPSHNLGLQLAYTKHKLEYISPSLNNFFLEPNIWKKTTDA